MLSLSDFQILRPLANGSFGKTYLAREHHPPHRNVVLKEVEFESLTNAEKKTARREAEILKMFKGVENVVTVYGCFRELGKMYIVMEYCSGGDLHQYIHRSATTPIPESQIWTWVLQLLTSLSEIHSRRVLHRDLKTKNLFLTSSSAVKIGDFGVSRSLTSTSEFAKTSIGTPYYLSPEICSARPYSYKTDVWSLGCVVYELCTLRHAFNSEGGVRGVIIRILRGKYSPISRNYSDELRELVKWMLQLDESKRPSVAEILLWKPIQRRLRAQTPAPIRGQSPKFSGSIQPHVVQPKGASFIQTGLSKDKVRPAKKVVEEHVRVDLPTELDIPVQVKFNAPITSQKPTFTKLRNFSPASPPQTQALRLVKPSTPQAPAKALKKISQPSPVQLIPISGFDYHKFHTLGNRTLHLPHSSIQDSIYHRIETLRQHLEHLIGLPKLLSTYRVIERIGSQGNGSQGSVDEDAVTELLKEVSDNQGALVLIIQLLHCEELAYQ